MKFPDTKRATAEAINSFHEFTECKIPQIYDAIDGPYIEKLSPFSESKLECFSRNQKYTINTEAVVGSNLLVLDVATGIK